MIYLSFCHLLALLPRSKRTKIKVKIGIKCEKYMIIQTKNVNDKKMRTETPRCFYGSVEN